MYNKIIIAIDGTSSTGKSTLAKRLADKINYIYIDSGAMYRALTYYAIDKKYITESVFDSQKLIKDINNIKIDFQLNKDNDKYEIHLNDIPVEKHIRTLTVSNYVSRIATIGELRKHMVKVQHSLGAGKGIIMDGRDIGTVVFPNAELKFYLDASTELRAKRRFKELIDNRHNITFDEVLSNIKLRDEQDINRENSPLKAASDSIIIKTDKLNLSELEDIMFSYITPLMSNK
ncbi:MAG: (d)CMP kinase [Flavobacteriaceae bacterium]|nr:MAG: (d)CMP kinase [Cryomorphaceae bacterium]